MGRIKSRTGNHPYKNRTEGMEKVLFKATECSRIMYNRLGFTETRPMTQSVKDTYKKDNLVGVEIGTFRGTNAKNILGRLKIKTLYLVDPYIKYSEYHDFEYRSIDDNLFNEAKRGLRKYKNNVKFIRKFSSDAINDIPDNLDFVYIDGNHDYPFVKKDIELYWPKVKKGGIFGGHNIEVPGVFQAVSEFMGNRNININGSDWWFVK